MMRWIAVALAPWLVACSNDTFVTGDGGADAGDGGRTDAPSDAIGKGDALGGDAACASTAAVPCGGGCSTVEACCVTSNAASCSGATCLSGEALACESQADCAGNPAGTACCLTNIESVGGCPTTATSSGGNSLHSKCATDCGGSDRPVCKLGGKECTNGTCVPVLLDVDTNYEIGLCL